MSTAPLDRDTQIALMKGAKERHEARVNRWKNDASVKRALRQPAETASDAYSSLKTSLKLKNCA
jgi:hypothetical protein